MKIRLVLSKTANDPLNAWLEVKTVEVEIPLEKQGQWQVIGAEWPEEQKKEAPHHA